jgi:MerR family transcriptional regulator/heat shock protein HspR
MAGREEEYFTISVVAKRFSVHPQTLRVYEREGLLAPRRSKGNTRLYTRGDLRRLETILNLTRELGVNLAGVEIILRMREQLLEMDRQQEEILRYVMEEVQPDKRHKKTLVRIRTGKPVKVD